MTHAARVIARAQRTTRLLQRAQATATKSIPMAATQRVFSAHRGAVPMPSRNNVRWMNSSTTDGQPDPFADPVQIILDNALRHVDAHGWTVEALAAGAKDAGYPSVAHGMLPRGAIELVDYFMDKCHDQMRATLIANTTLLQSLTVAERLKFGVRTRLELIAPVLRSWPQAMGLGALPQNAPTTVQKLAKLSDEIWYLAGDQSTDASWYTKRALLTGIYASTELFMLSDESPNFEETWKFLDRRVDETITLGELPRNLNDVAGMVNIGVQSLLSAAVSLAGPLGSQIVKNSPLANVPNPISAVGSMPSSIATGLAAAGFPSTPAAASVKDLEPKDLADIDAELEKLGGADSRRN